MSLASVLSETLKAKGISIRAAAKQIGVSHTTLNRILEGQPVDVATMEKLSAWLNIPLSTLIDVAVPAADPSTSLSARIAMVLERKPELATLFNEIVDQIDAGNMSNEDLDEVVRYAAYRLNLATMRSSNERSGSELPQKNG